MTNITPLIYTLLALFVYSGVTLGYFLARWMKRRTQRYKKASIIISNTLIGITIPLVVLFINPLLVFTAISAALLLLALLLMTRPDSIYVYPFLGLIFFWSSFSFDLLILQSVVIFIYGIMSSSIELKKTHDKNFRRILYKISFLFTALFPLLLKAVFWK